MFCVDGIDLGWDKNVFKVEWNGKATLGLIFEVFCQVISSSMNMIFLESISSTMLICSGT